jgi:hypothetical protein
LTPSVGLIALLFGLVALAVGAHVILLQAHDNNRPPVPSVLRTWADNGYFRLHGLVLHNPGELEAGEQLQTHPGFRGFSLLPHYWLYLLTGRMNVAYSVFYVLMTMVSAVSVWLFLGRNSRALLFAIAYVMSPGVVRWSIFYWDPMPGTILLGLPVIALFVKAVGPDRKSRAFVLGALCCVAAYSQVEYASGYVLALGWLTLLVLLWGSNGRRLFWTSVFLGVLLLGGAIPLMFQKAAGNSLSFQSLVLEYTVGNDPTYTLLPAATWTDATRRLAFANLVGLLPLWLLFVGVLIHGFRSKLRVAIRALLPLLAGFASILILRNWMAYQQWASTPIICVAVILSVYLMQSAPSIPPRPEPSPVVLLGWTSVFVVYSVLLAAFFQMNCIEGDTLYRLVNDHTSRKDVVLIGPHLTPYIVPNGGSILDRKVVFEATVVDSQASRQWQHPQFALDSVPMPQFGTPIATMHVKEWTWVQRLLNWYYARVSRKNAPVWTFETFYLYKVHENSQPGTR